MQPDILPKIIHRQPGDNTRMYIIFYLADPDLKMTKGVIPIFDNGFD